MEKDFTGFSSCRFVDEFEKSLKLKKIARRNEIRQSTEAILKPKEFLEFVENIREKLKEK